MGTRDGSLVGDSVTLGFRHVYGGVLADANQIMGVQILNQQFQPVGFIAPADIVHLGLGSYQAVAPAALFPAAGAYHDVWQFQSVPSGPTNALTFDINVVSFLAQPKANYGALLARTLDDCDAAFLKTKYLWPVWTTLSNGWYLPDSLLQHHIDMAITWARREIGIPLRQVRVLTPPYSEQQSPSSPVLGVDYEEDGRLVDWEPQESQFWGSIRLPASGILSVQGVRGVYGGRTVYRIPPEWVQGNELRMGVIRIRPTTAGTINQIVDNNGQFLDVTLLEAIGQQFVPGFWAVDYTYGQQNGQLSAEIVDTIMKKAACITLDQLAMAISRGISARSAQVDGLSSSITLMANAEKTQFNALVNSYSKDLEPEQLAKLRQYYRGLSAFII